MLRKGVRTGAIRTAFRGCSTTNNGCCHRRNRCSNIRVIDCCSYTKRDKGYAHDVGRNTSNANGFRNCNHTDAGHHNDDIDHNNSPSVAGHKDRKVDDEARVPRACDHVARDPDWMRGGEERGAVVGSQDGAGGGEMRRGADEGDGTVGGAGETGR